MKVARINHATRCILVRLVKAAQALVEVAAVIMEEVLGAILEVVVVAPVTLYLTSSAYTMV